MPDIDYYTIYEPMNSTKFYYYSATSTSRTSTLSNTINKSVLSTLKVLLHHLISIYSRIWLFQSSKEFNKRRSVIEQYCFIWYDQVTLVTWSYETVLYSQYWILYERGVSVFIPISFIWSSYISNMNFIQIFCLNKMFEPYMHTQRYGGRNSITAKEVFKFQCLFHNLQLVYTRMGIWSPKSCFNTHG